MTGNPQPAGIDYGTYESQIAIYDLSGATAVRPLVGTGANHFPIWTPDGRRVTFSSGRRGELGVFWQRVDGTGHAERLFKPEPGIRAVPDAWSRDGQTLLSEKARVRPEWTIRRIRQR
jgi:hypothetical protein